MRQKIFIFIVSGCLLFSTPLVTEAADIQMGDDFSLAANATINDNLIATGSTHNIQGKVEGDAIIAGSEILLHGLIVGDLMAAGSKLSLFKGAEVQKNAYLAGSEVYLEGKLNDDLYLYAGQARIISPIAGDARIKGQDITINAEILGSVKVTAPQVTVGANTHIHGDFKYSSANEPVIESGAKIDGQIVKLPLEATTSFFGSDTYWLYLILTTLASWLFALLLLALFPRNVQSVSVNISINFGKSFLTGLITIILAAIVIPLLAITIIGLPIAVLFGFILLTFLFFSNLPAAFFLASRLSNTQFDQDNNRLFTALYILASLFIVSLITSVPFIGPIVQILITVAGIGAIITSKRALYRAVKEQKLN